MHEEKLYLEVVLKEIYRVLKTGGEARMGFAGKHVDNLLEIINRLKESTTLNFDHKVVGNGCLLLRKI